jgi:hypothetical protein
MDYFMVDDSVPDPVFKRLASIISGERLSAVIHFYPGRWIRKIPCPEFTGPVDQGTLIPEY